MAVEPGPTFDRRHRWRAGVGRALVERLAESADDAVVIVELESSAVGWIADHPAVRRFLAGARGGAIVNVSSHQANRPVRGALTYATAVPPLPRREPDAVRLGAVERG